MLLGALIVLALAGAVAVYLLTRPQPSDQQKIVALVAQAQRAVERHNSTGLTQLISRDYYDSSGFDRQQLVGMIVSWMRGGEDVLAVPEIAGMDIRDPFADVQLRVRIWSGRQPSGPGQPYQMKLRLRKEGRTWRVISAEGWGEAQSDIMGGE